MYFAILCPFNMYLLQSWELDIKWNKKKIQNLASNVIKSDNI